MELNPMAECARKSAEEKRSDRRRQHFIQQSVAPLRESEEYSVTKRANVRCKVRCKSGDRRNAPKQRAEIFITLLREHEAMRVRDELADAEIEMTDWLL